LKFCNKFNPPFGTDFGIRRKALFLFAYITSCRASPRTYIVE
jgi:hypothetical protein